MKEYKQKRLAEYCEKFGLCQQKGSCQCAKELKFISETIDQAVAEERARAVEIVSFIDYDFLADLSNEEKYPIEYAIYSERKRIQLALADLNKPLTDK